MGLVRIQVTSQTPPRPITCEPADNPMPVTIQTREGGTQSVHDPGLPAIWQLPTDLMQNLKRFLFRKAFPRLQTHQPLPENPPLPEVSSGQGLNE